MARLQYTVPDDLKKQAESLLDEQGIPPRIATQLFYKAIVFHRGLPFDLPKVPNERTKETIQKARKGEEVVQCQNGDDLCNKLGL